VRLLCRLGGVRARIIHAEEMTSLPIPGAAQYLHINPHCSDWPALLATASLAGIGIDTYRSPAVAIARLPEVRERYGTAVRAFLGSRAGYS
jgi:hypothetical protein